MNLEEFLKRSLSPFHVVCNCEELLNKHNFQKLSFLEKWNLEKGGRYYLTKNQSTIIAFVVGDLSSYEFNIAEAHTDFPCLKVKGNKLFDSIQGKRLNVETYGLAINYSLFDLPLKIAGRISYNNGEKVESKIVESDFNVTIPSLAIHQNRDVNNSAVFSVQKELLPMVGDVEDMKSIFNLKDEILDSDLYVVPDISPYYSGKNDEFICSPRLDNLASVYSIITAICDCNPKGVSVACCFDNEEVGSKSKQGASSMLLNNILNQINNSLGFDESEIFKACERGVILSIDNAHATHPSHFEKNDGINEDEANLIYLNGGIVVKHNIVYSTDGYTAGLIKNMLNKNSIKYQDFYCNSDIKCGSTLGLFSSALLNMNACDIGISQLAMHSSIEMMGNSDIKRMQECCKNFFNYTFEC